MSDFPDAFEDIAHDFELFEDWEDRFRYIIELGDGLGTATDSLYDEKYKVRGCASQVWLRLGPQDPVDNIASTPLRFEADSDSRLVKGLIAIMLTLANNQTAAQILKTDFGAALRRLQLDQHLTAQRNNGLAAMQTKLRSIATKLTAV